MRADLVQCHLEIKVIPGSSRTEIAGWLGDALKIKVAAPPEKGKANQAVIKLLATLFGINEAALTIVNGGTSQRKVIEIKGLTQQQIEKLLPLRDA
ncbi:MAG: DUF167 domain-containing protein [Pseudomonadales bacterium]